MSFKKSLSISVCLVISLLANAQIDKTLPIIYQFPNQIDSLLEVYVDNTISKEHSMSIDSFYIMLTVYGDTTSMMICKKNNAGRELRSLISRTNRITKYKGHTFSVIFEGDLLYSSDFQKIELSKFGRKGIFHIDFLLSGKLIKFYMVNNKPIILKYEYCQP